MKDQRTPAGINNPDALTPLAREILLARDDVLRILVALGDDRKESMVLSYVIASWLAQRGRLPEAYGWHLPEAFLQALKEGVMTVPLDQLKQGMTRQ